MFDIPFVAIIAVCLMLLMAVVLTSSDGSTRPAKISTGAEEIAAPVETSNTECKTDVWVGAARRYGSNKETRQYQANPEAASVRISRNNKEVSWNTHGYRVVGLYFWRTGTSEDKPIRRNRSEIEATHTQNHAKINLSHDGPLGGAISTIQLCLEKE